MTLNKYFIFSDVHGEYEALMNGLNEAGYDSMNKTHILVSLGDNFDRGPASAKVWDFLRRHNAICVKGNHDAMFQEYLEKGMDGEFVLFNILHNGLGATIKSFAGIMDKDRNDYSVKDFNRIRTEINNRQPILPWLQKLPLYFETDTMIFVHAGINPSIADWKQSGEDYMLWDIEDSHKNCPNVNGKLVIVGHHHAARVRERGKPEWGDTDISKTYIQTRSCTEDGEHHTCALKSYGNTDENRPYINGNKICIDGCTNLTKKVNVLVIEDFPKREEPEEKIQKDEGIRVTANLNDPYTWSYSTTTTGPMWFNL